MSEPLQADTVILVGGKGTRLREVLKDRPKPMAEVAGRPFVEWLLVALRSQGVRRVILAIGYMGEVVESHFQHSVPSGLEIVFSQESRPLGTGGGARNALEMVLTERVLVLNGDSYCPFELAYLARIHVQAKAQATLWLVQVDDCRRYGAVEVEPDGRVRAFREKSGLRTGLINAGVYLFERQALEAIPAQRAVSLETEVFPSLVGRGLYAAVGHGPFLDIGTPESYASATQFFAHNMTAGHTPAYGSDWRRFGPVKAGSHDDDADDEITKVDAIN